MNKPMPFTILHSLYSPGINSWAIKAMKDGFFLLLLSLLTLPAFAQSDKAIYEKTIDEFNRITIRYVLAADTENKEAPELARKLEDPTYELKQLPRDLEKVYDGKSKTEVLSNSIAGHKSKFVAGKPLAQQFAPVIQLIHDNRKDKPYLASLERDLVAVKEAALKDAVASAPAPAPAAGALPESDQLVRMQAQIDGLQQRLNNLPEPTSYEAGSASAGLPIYVPLLLFLLGGLSVLNFWMLWKWKNRKRSHSTESGQAVNLAAGSQAGGDYSHKFREMEKKAESLRAEWKRDLEELRKEIKRLATSNQSNHSNKETHATGSKTGAVLPGQSKVNPTTHANTRTDVKKHDVAQSELSNLGVATPGVATPGQTVELEVKKTVPDSEMNRSIKKYTDYPKENGFPVAQLSDTTDRRSIFEISMLPGQEQATFSIVNDPAIHEYAIQNRERLLRDACDFEVSSSKHTRIEVVQPGTLLMNGNAWQIQSKAKIKFV
jgi:hypothetical protein